MKPESIKIALAQLDYHTGNFEFNTEKIIHHIQRAKSEMVDLIVFSELCVCGYPPRDFLEFDDFIEACEQSVQAIAKACVGIAAIIGAPSKNPVIEGKDLYNSAFLLYDGAIKDVVHKSLLPNYDIFDEYRYFEPNRTFHTVSFKDIRIALTVCEDLWNINDNPMYVINPMDELMKFNPDIMINIAASPFNKKQADTRLKVLQSNVKKYGLPLLYVNHIGAQTQLIFDGGSTAFNSNSEVLDTLTFFKEDVRIFQFNTHNKQLSALHQVNQQQPLLYEKINDALVLGIREYFIKQGFKKAILGLSGGIDSAVVLVLAAEALGRENVRAILLPSAFSSEGSITDAVALANTIGVQYDVISIEDTFNSLQNTLAPHFENKPFDIAEENMQSRSRGVILMALSNKFGYILLNTSNKSELAVGYGTLYGDMCGGLSVIGDLYKTEVYGLARFMNRHEEVIPEAIITKAPSAELRPNQKDSDSLPDYEILDKVLELYIEQRQSPNDIIALGYDDTLVKRVLKMVNSNEWKRIQAPPVLRVSEKAFGPGRRMPIVAKYLN
ncbi:MAG: NAD+ synthase [Bacteroidota bacterium]